MWEVLGSIQSTAINKQQTNMPALVSYKMAFQVFIGSVVLAFK
jgi:hypothetical protein